MSDNKKEYVLGFFFDTRTKEVALIRKTKPEFQKGKLNGIGGKIEPSDSTPEWAMVREFQEETGMKTMLVFWHRFAIMEFPHARVFCFSYEGNPRLLQTTTDEVVEIHPADQAFGHPQFLPNLRWLIPLAIASIKLPMPCLTVTEGAGDYASLKHDAAVAGDYALQQDGLVARFYIP